MICRVTTLNLLVMMTAYTTVEVSSSSECQKRSSHFAVSSGRNATGHWRAKLRIDQEGSPGGTTGLVLLDIEPTSSRCDGVRTDSLVVTIQGPPPPPSPGYNHLLGFGYYKVHEVPIVWEEAKIVCEKEDAHLLILNSEAEAAAVLQLLKGYPKVDSWVHIGFNDKMKEGLYVTIFGRALSEAGYTKWDSKQPDNKGGVENCGTINPKTMGLNDIGCANRNYPFICEQSA